MAKNTGSTAFRGVDVDQYGDEKYEDDAVVDDGVNGPNESDVQSMLSQSIIEGSQTRRSISEWKAEVAEVLRNAPYQPGGLKFKNVKATPRILSAPLDSQMPWESSDEDESTN